MYRLTLRMTRDGLGFFVSERDVARLCLGEGDQLVVAEVVRVPAGGIAAVPAAGAAEAEAPTAGFARPAGPAASAGPPEPGPRSAPPAPTLEERPEQTERDRTAFRRLGR